MVRVLGGTSDGGTTGIKGMANSAPSVTAQTPSPISAECVRPNSPGYHEGERRPQRDRSHQQPEIEVKVMHLSDEGVDRRVALPEDERQRNEGSQQDSTGDGGEDP